VCSSDLNRIKDFADGAKIEGSNANVFDFNTLTKCSDGFSLFTSSGNNISRNQIMYGGSGVHLAHNCESNKVFRNIIVGNGNGIAIEYDAIGNMVFENNLTSNEYGVNIGEKDYLLNPIGVPSGNVFYRNNFIDNVQSVHISEKVPQNFWNNGAIGNFWSDYNGTITQAGNFYGRFYVINDDNIDYTPLLNPVSIQLIEDPETVDTLPPVISIVSPENETSLAVNIALNFTINEITSHITYSLNGEENITVSGNTTLTGLANGNYNLTVYAWDAVGNVGSSQTIDFVVAQETEPEPFPIVPVAVVSGASAIAIGVGLVVYFKKRKREAVQG
jgi:parallel beta-helix repeat protein